MFGVLLAFVLVQPVISVASAQGDGPPTSPRYGPPDQRRDAAGNVFLSTEIITIMANGELPMFYFWYTADENGSLAKFSVSYLMLVEFEDANGDRAFQSNESLYFAPLAAYEWTIQTGSVTDENGSVTEVWLKYTKGGSKSGGMMPPIDPPGMTGGGSVERFEDVTLQFWAHIYLEDYSGEISDEQGVRASYLVAGGTELKIDIEIGNFPFSTETSQVALQSVLREDQAARQQNRERHRYRVREHQGNFTGDSSVDWSAAVGNESRFENRVGTDTQTIQFVDAVDDAALGFYSWLDKAVMTLPGAPEEVVNVTASYLPTGNGLALYLAYPNFNGGSIVHDPSIGLYADQAPRGALPTELVFVAGIGIVVVLIAVAAVIKKR